MHSKSTSKIKIRAYVLSVIALLSAILSYMSTVSMGFPDGHLTEFEIAAKPLLIGYSIIALLFGILFIGFARFPNQKLSALFFYFGLGLFVLIVIGAVILYFHFNSTLNHGGGG
ncbi:hypothetical protein [Maribacter sp. 2308TA10-17]|uniref:hypothetical protein n=1 Tax=Maribacter sp. 2308TA10-17 TaxID=3386276 RepID=UPI0039BD3F0E